MRFVHRFIERQNRRLSDIYGGESGIQYRASNMCHIMLVYMLIISALFLFTILIDSTTFSTKRMFYAGFLATLFGLLGAFYAMTLKGYFKYARVAYLSINMIFVIPATMLTGGVPHSATMTILPLPLLYAFCLYSGRKAFVFTGIYTAIVLSMIIVSLMPGVNLPDFSQNDVSSVRKIVTFLIFLSMLGFTLISLQHENRRAVKKAQDAANAKSDFLANMSHEIRTPMNGVLGLTDVLLTKPMPPDQKDLLRVVQVSGQSLLTIINDVLDFSKLDAGQVKLDPVPFNLKSVLTDVVSLMEAQVQEKGLYLRLHYPDDCPESFIGDDGRLRQVFLNIIGNAIKFTTDGGVELSVKIETDGAVCVDIRDTGIGIAPDKVDTIFDQFTQADTSTSRRFGGTGLGLAISLKLAQAMDGDIAVSSELDAGSTFSVRIPLPQDTGSQDTGVETEPVSERPIPERAPLIVLSRTQIFYHTLRPMIETSGFSCTLCESAGGLRTYLQARKPDASERSIVVLEWAKDVADFMPYADKLRALEHGENLRFILCLRKPQDGGTGEPNGIVVLCQPYTTASIKAAVSRLEVLDSVGDDRPEALNR